MNENSKIILAALGGAVIGAGLALLFAPASGKETRENISDELEDAKDKVKESVKDAMDKMNELKEDLIAKGKETLDELKA